MASSTNATDPVQEKNPVGMVTLPIVDTENVSWTRLLDQPGITFQSIPVLDLNGQPITVNVNTIDNHIQVSASGITRLASSDVTVTHTEGQNSDVMTKSGSQGNSYSVPSSHLSSVFSEGMQVSIVSTQDGLPSSSCMLELMDDSYQPGNETTFTNVEEASILPKEHLQQPGGTGLPKTSSEEIFSNIQAFLSDSILNAILSIKSTFLDDLQSRNSLIWHREVNAWCVSGKLSELLGLQCKLLNLLKGSRKHGGGGDEETCTTSDKCVQTEPTSASDFSAMCDILVPTVSAYGRGIRQPARFNQYSFVAEADDSQEEERPKRSRRKRKVLQLFKHIMTENGQISDSKAPQSVTNSQSATVEKVNYFLSGSDSNANQQPDEGNREYSGNQGEADKHGHVAEYTGSENQQPTDQREASNEDSTDYTEYTDTTRIPKKKTRKDYENLAPFKYFCKICSFKSKRESHFAKHMKLHTSNTEMFECKQCDFKTIRSSTLKCHEVCHSKSLYNCDHCKYRSTSSVLLSKHIKVKHQPSASDKGRHPRNLLYLRCQHCSFKTIKAQKFALHLKSHGATTLISEETAKLLQKVEETSTVELQCNDCNYKTMRKEHLARHRNNVHSDLRPFLCDLCGCSFKRADTLTAHKVTHIDKKYRVYQYKCKECEKDFRSRAHLSEHMAMHSSLRMYLCDICGVGFKRKSCQQKHMKSIHLNPRSFQCRDCNKSFNTKYALLRHTRTHDTALPNQIHTEDQVSLQQIQITHTFQCSECEKTFHTKYTLLRHMQTHDPTIQIPEDQEQESLPQIEAQIATFETLDEQALDSQALDGQAQELSVQDIITGGQVLEEYDQNNLNSNETAMATIYLTNPLPLNLSPVLSEQGTYK
ncbi:zinc finger protein 112-like isoform X1 [Mizuhopecten yessoensis]|uniref:zinc finger protein 112-like isoform X1 n=1 Tax=Mizuhopecten yessoensis TaxID=6573 RepID=UPI000B45D27B|nr:zinc finger protein 112-like isoform X1 [Mizuhopecten yessoensis]